MSNKDYYKILEVAENASLDDIKKAYRRLSFKHHPDKNPQNQKEAEERFKQVSEAYYVIGDEKRRAEYDAFRKGYGPYKGGEFTGAEGFDFEEILKHFSQGARGGRGSKRSFQYGNFEDIFDIFDHMGGGGHTEYIYTSGNKQRGFSQQREDTDLKATLQIPKEVAIKGGEVLFNHNGKKITLKIKPNTPSGHKLRFRGQGQECRCCAHSGDLIITIKH
ncbi:MAG: DnaJ domain-containing protein [Candidatus Omnitrophota bacterium]